MATTSLRVRLAQPGVDPEEIEQTRSRLRADLLELDVDDVRLPAGGPVPPGTRAVELVDLGTLVVLLQGSAELARRVLAVLRTWSDAEPERTVEVTVGDASIALTGASPKQQERLIEEFIDVVVGR